MKNNLPMAIINWLILDRCISPYRGGRVTTAIENAVLD
jgi:hypothetical protein